MIEHVQICDTCGSRDVVKIITFEELDTFVKAMAARVAETKGRGEFHAKERMYAICSECWALRPGSQ